MQRLNSIWLKACFNRTTDSDTRTVQQQQRQEQLSNQTAKLRKLMG